MTKTLPNKPATPITPKKAGTMADTTRSSGSNSKSNKLSGGRVKFASAPAPDIAIKLAVVPITLKPSKLQSEPLSLLPLSVSASDKQSVGSTSIDDCAAGFDLILNEKL